MIVDDLLRIMPYILMARDHGASGTSTLASMYWPMNINAIFSRGSTLTIKVLTLASVAIGFLVPFKAGLFLLSSDNDNDNMMTLNFSRISACVLIVLYVLMSSCCIFITVFVWRCQSTGLKWDPTSMADIVALFHNSNARIDFQGINPNHYNLSACSGRKGCRRTCNRTYNLGTAICNHQDGTHTKTYGIRATNLASDEHIEVHQQLQSKVLEESIRVNNRIKNAAVLADHEGELLFPGYRKMAAHRWANPAFYTACGITWLSVISLGVYALSQNYVSSGFSVANILNCKGSNTSDTCAMQRNETYTSANFTASTFQVGGSLDGAHDLWLYVFLLRVIPTNFAGSYVAILNGVVNSYSFAQPFSDMFSKITTAESSVLLDYFSGSMLTIITQAFEFGHYKLLYIAILQLVSNAYPILVAGLFSSITNYGSHVSFAISPFAFWGTMVFSIVYVFTIPVIWRTDKRKLIKQWNIANLMGLCWASNFADDAEFDASNENMSKRLFRARIVAKEFKFAYGYYKCAKGCYHPGFDAVEKDGCAINNVRQWADLVPKQPLRRRRGPTPSDHSGEDV